MAYTYTAPQPTAVTPFSQLLPYDKIFNPNLVDQLATSQLSPEIDRLRGNDMNLLGRNLALSGAYRTGQADVQRGNLMNSYARQLAEQKAQFTGGINDWLTNWYNTQSSNYYKDPSRYVQPTLPTMDEYMQKMGITPMGAKSYGIGSAFNPSTVGDSLKDKLLTPAFPPNTRNIFQGGGGANKGLFY